MGQIASRGLNNLAFFSRKPRIEIPLVQNSEPLTTYSASKTYVTLIVGDGDNLSFLKRSRREWMLERVDRCRADPSYKGCFPLVWTLSPQTLHAAPDWARWYFNKSYTTGHDYFALPPSGDLYAYPTEMPESDQAAFIRNTERDCVLLNTSGSVVWEWFTAWGRAIHNYFPKYAERGVMRSGFAVNVPYLFPIPEFVSFFENVHYKVLGGRFVLFKPREWRGTSKNTTHIPFTGNQHLSAKDMAAELNRYPKGTVSHIYLTSDGGATLGDLYDLVALLDEHVAVVPAGVATDMALAASAQHDQQFVI